MSTMIGCFEPVARDEYLDRFGILPAPADRLTDEFWDEVHDKIQAILVALDEEVCKQVPGVRIVGAKTKGRNFLLCSYRTFEPPDDMIDPVVFGITFTANGDHVVVDADISGEQGGDVIAELPNRIVASSNSAVIAAAREVATELTEFGKLLAKAMCDKARLLD